MMAVMRFCLRPRAGRSAHSLARASRSLATSYLYVEVTRRGPLEPRLLYGSNPFLRKQKIAAVNLSFHHALVSATCADALGRQQPQSSRAQEGAGALLHAWRHDIPVRASALEKLKPCCPPVFVQERRNHLVSICHSSGKSQS